MCSSKKHGGGGYNGHRIYSSFPHLVDTGYLSFLDEDNWYENDHIEKCIKTIENNNLEWCYSLRNIYEDGKFICQDNCESLGKLTPLFNYNLVDTSCYFLKTKVAINSSYLYNSSLREQDRDFYKLLRQLFPNFDCTGHYTMNYSVGETRSSVVKEFFLENNKLTYAMYRGNYPWLYQ